MKIIALGKDVKGAAPEEFQALAEAEARKVWDLQQSEFLREAHFRRDRNDAVLILEANNVEEAENRLNDLPYVEAGLISFELIPLKPYPGLQRLFK